MDNRRPFYTNIPNILSVGRMMLVLPFIIGIHDFFVYECTKNLFLVIAFFSIIASDAADGFLARKLKCASNTGAKLDIISDALYTILSLTAFAYFSVIPLWFVFVMALKLLEFIITSRILKYRRKSETVVFFDKIGKTTVSIVMLLPGIFVFRCVIFDYKLVMNIVIYLITAMLTLSSINRIIRAVPWKSR